MADEIISASECREIVLKTLDLGPDNDDSVAIVGYEIEQVGEEILGFLGEYLRLVVRVKDENGVKALKYFLKLLPRKNLETRKMIEEIGMFNREVLLYKDLFTKMKNRLDRDDPDSKWRPNCYISRYDCIVMEEIDKSYKHLPDRMAFETEHVEELLKTVARMHGASLEFEKIQLKGESLEKDYGSLMEESPLKENNTWFKAGLELIYFVAEKYKNSFKQNFKIPPKPKFMDLLNKVYFFKDNNPDFENVLCHRDLWTKNIMFRFPSNSTDFKSPQHSLILDFQICRYQPPAVDVLLSIFFNTNRELRSKELTNWFKFYLSYLKEEVLKESLKLPQSELDKITFLDFEVFEKTLNYYYLFPLVMNCIFVPLTHLKPGILSKMQTEEPQRYFQICNVNRNDFVAEQMERDPLYRDCVLEVVEELVEFLLTRC